MTTKAATFPSAGSLFFRTRLGSLLAVLPLGIWSVIHLWNNLAAFRGAEAWEDSVTHYSHPIAQLVTGLVVLLPLVIHSVWGIGRLLSVRPNNIRYGYYTNLKFALQRVTAVGLLLFLGAHLWLAMIRPRLIDGRPEAFSDISREMHFHTPTLIVYVFGVLGLAYHLANGLHTFCMGWGIVESKRALRKLESGVIGLFLVFLAMGWGAIYALYTAGGAAG